MSELKKHTLKVRVTELENRLDNLHILVSNIAANQEEIVTAITTNDVVVKEEFDMSGFSEDEQEEVVDSVNDEITLNYERQDRNQLRVDDEAERLS